MNKSELIEELAQKTAMERNALEVIVNKMFQTIEEALVRDERVSIAGFGIFSVKHRSARQGRNPRTGEPIAIAASRAPGFKAAKALRDRLNP